jgi:DNA-binding PadR family transcriptional regulator
MGRDSLGEFEQLVLLACIRLGDEAYVVPIVQEIEERTGRRVTHGHVYVALRRLEEKGLVTSRLGAATPERGGRPKRFFRVRPRARKLLEGARDALSAMWQGLEA